MRWSGCLAGWVGVAVSLPFSLRNKLASLSFTQGGSLSAPCVNWFSLGEGRIGNISSKPPTSVDGGSRTMET